MPLTPLHTLSVLWFYLRYPRLIDPAALIISTSILDVESIVGIILHRPHGIWHSYVGAVLVSLPMAVLLFMFERRSEGWLTGVFSALHLPFFPPYKFESVVFTVMLGSVIHVALDSFTHRSFPNILFPFRASANPFWFGFEFAWLVYSGVIALSIYSLVRWLKSEERSSAV